MKVLLVTDQYIDIRPDGCYCNFALLGTLKNISSIGELYVVASKLFAKKAAAQPLNQRIDFIDANRVKHFKPLTSSLKEYFSNKGYNKNILKEIIPQMDLVVGYAPGHNLYQALKIAKRNNVPFMTFLVACPWDTMSNHQRLLVRLSSPFYYMWTKIVIKNSDYVHYVTKSFLQQRYPTNGKSLGCSDANLDKANPTSLSMRLEKSKSKQPSDNINIITIGHIDVRYKGQEYAIRAIAQLLKEGKSNYHYHLIGAGEGTYLKKLAAQLQVEENVHLLGRKTPEEVMNILTDADIYVQPSITEGLPRSVVEAMSTALPCIGFNTGGIPELLEPEYIAKLKDVNGLVQRIKDLEDGEKYQNAATRNFHKAKEYEHSILSSKIRQFFGQIKENIDK